MSANFNSLSCDKKGPKIFMTKNVVKRCRQMFLLPICVSFFSSVLHANTLELIRKIPHSGYSEGLDYYENYLWNSFPKEIRKIDPKDGTIIQTFKPATDYSESLTWLNGVLWNVSFSNNEIYSGKLEGTHIGFKKRGIVPEVHAWGLVHDGKNLIMTGDYSNKLYFMDPKTVKVVKTLQTDAKDIEDLAWDGKWIWASSFTANKGQIFRIHPETGKVGSYYPIPEPDACPVIDGIAYDGKALWVTGKECASIYYFKIPPPQVFPISFDIIFAVPSSKNPSSRPTGNLLYQEATNRRPHVQNDFDKYFIDIQRSICCKVHPNSD